MRAAAARFGPIADMHVRVSSRISLLLLAAGAAAVAGCGFADVPGDATHGSVTRFELASTVLGTTVPFHVYLPPGGAAPGERLPVVYLLHGYRGDETAWFKHGRAHETADRLLRAGAMPRCMLVAVYGDRSFYVNSPRGRWADYVGAELPEQIGARFPAARGPRGRAYIGNSMGGWGALFLGLRHRSEVAAVASLSGMVDPSAYATADRLKPTHVLRTLPRHATLPAIYADCGTADGYRMHEQLPPLHAVLRARGDPPHAIHYVPGGTHSWWYWRERFPHALQFVGRFLQAE